MTFAWNRPRSKRVCSVSGAGGGWVGWAVVVLAAVADAVVGIPSGGPGEDVPEVAEVDVVVEVGHGLGSRSGGDGAVGATGGELEELVVGVLAIVGLSLGPDPVGTGVLDAHLTLVLGVGVNIVVDELGGLGDGIGARDSGEGGADVAAGVESAVIWEAVVEGDGNSSNGGEDEGLHT